MKQVKRFINDLIIAALFGLAVGIFLEIKEVQKENERLYKDIKQIEWVKVAKEVQSQNKVVNWGLGDGDK